MAGHSKWKNIQHRKGAQDAKRGKVFSKIALEITVATRIGGGNPDDNPRLRAALTKARAANMPKDNCQKAIKKGLGGGDNNNYVEKTYEGYGPGGVALIVECLTDNLNRTVGEVRNMFTKVGGKLGTDGSVSYMFSRKGMLVYKADLIADYDRLFEKAIDSGAEDVKESDGHYELLCEPSDLMALKSGLDELCPDPNFCEITYIPQNLAAIGEDTVAPLEKLIGLLEDLDDVQNVFHNADLP